jgi:hypothetical protein
MRLAYFAPRLLPRQFCVNYAKLRRIGAGHYGFVRWTGQAATPYPPLLLEPHLAARATRPFLFVPPPGGGVRHIELKWTRPSSGLWISSVINGLASK